MKDAVWLAIVVATTLVALFVAFQTGPHHDYIRYMGQWELVLAGKDPWSGSNAYAPAYNLLAVPYAIQPLLPKLMFVFVWITSSWYLIRGLVRRGVGFWWLAFWIVSLPFNPLFWTHVVIYGSVDGLVAGLCLLALVLRQGERHYAAGFTLALAVLLKLYPIAFAPFLALDGHRVKWQFVATLTLTITIGFALSVLVWGESTFDPFVRAVTRHSKILSIFRFLGGSFSPLQPWKKYIEHLSIPAMALAGGAVFAYAWRWKLPTVSGALAGVLTALALYRVGHIQFFLVVPLAAGYWYMIRLPCRDLFLTVALLACLSFLAGMGALYEFTKPPGGEFGLADRWSFLRDLVGLPAFATLAMLVAALLRHERHADAVPKPV